MPLRPFERSRTLRVMVLARPMARIFIMALEPGRYRVRALWRLITNPRRLKEAAAIDQSGLFDHACYRARNPDVQAKGIPALIHYVLWGAFEGRKPSALFDPAYYLGRYPDVARAGAEPLSHFLLHGASDWRNPGVDFDSRYYLEMNPDVQVAGVNPLVHFVQGGWRQNRNPSPGFDCAEYLRRYDDVRSAGVNPLVHYVNHGRAEGRTATPAANGPLPPSRQVRLTATGICRAANLTNRPVVLCLTHVSPWPPHAGNAYRIYRMLRWLQQAGFVIVPVIVPLVGETPADDAVRKIDELFSNVIVIDRAGDVRYVLSDVPDVLASLNGKDTARYSALLGEEQVMTGRERQLLILDRLYCPDAAIEVVLRLQSALGRYVFLAEYVWMSRVLTLIGGQAVKVLDTLDVFSTKAQKVLSYGIEDLVLSEDEETKRLRLADILIAIQLEEHRILRRLASERIVVTAGVDFDTIETSPLPADHRVLYIASNNAMNVRGLSHFLRFAWLAIVAKVPDAELIVAGTIGSAVQTGGERIRTIGIVKDLHELYRSARVVINPAEAGTGAKIKTVEALSHLRPVVTFPTGVEGLPTDLKELCDVVNDWQEFSESVTGRLVDGREHAFSSGDRSRIERATSAETVYANLAAILSETLGREY